MKRNSCRKNQASRLRGIEPLNERILLTTWHNVTLAEDVTNDGIVGPIDALRVINELNAREFIDSTGLFARGRENTEPFLDVNNDGVLSPVDALRVVNYLNSLGPNAFVISEHTANTALVGTVQPTQQLGSDVVFEFSTDRASALALATDDHLSGDTNAPVVLIEYLSLQCPSCRHYHDMLQELKTEFSEELLVVSRHLPLSAIFANSSEAALFAEAAAQQEMFDEMVDLLFLRQDDWSGLADPTSTFEQYASELGLDVSEVQAAVGNADTAARVARDSIAATQELGLSGAPSFFINDQPLRLSDVPDINAFRSRIQQSVDANVSAISLDRTTGELRVANGAGLDHENNNTITFNVVASNATNSETIPVTISLSDAADESVIPFLPAGAIPTTTATGLQFYDLELGDGASPIATDSVRVGYVGYLPDGTVFDSNQDVAFSLLALIEGFSEATQGMKEGGTRRMIIPPDLAYGSRGNPAAGIGGMDTIVFDVVLREVV